MYICLKSHKCNFNPDSPGAQFTVWSLTVHKLQTLLPTSEFFLFVFPLYPCCLLPAQGHPNPFPFMLLLFSNLDNQPQIYGLWSPTRCQASSWSFSVSQRQLSLIYVTAVSRFHYSLRLLLSPQTPHSQKI